MKHRMYRMRSPFYGKAICCSLMFFAVQFMAVTEVLGSEWMWNSKFPLQFSDGTQLPAPFADDVKLSKKIESLQQKYAPFVRDLTPEPAFERPEQLLSALPWKFKEDPGSEGESKRWFAVDASEDGWSPIQLPDYREYALGWYRTSFDGPSWSADRIILRFDAVDYSARVYLNDKYIGEHNGYYLPFEFDVTDLLKPTGNILAVRVDNPQCWDGQQHSFQGDGMGTSAYSDLRGVVQFSNAAGIYQPVKLIGRSNTYINNVKITPNWPNIAKIEIGVTNDLEKQTDLKMEISIIPRNFKGKTTSGAYRLKVSKEIRDVISPKLTETKYWTPETPYLYSVRIKLKDSQGKTLDCIDKTFGMRWISQADDGTFFLNHKPYYMRGSGAFGNFWLPTLHQDADAVVKDILLFKAANLDLIRPHIHTLPEWFYQYADMYGLMIYTDMPLNSQEGFVGGRKDMLSMYAEEAKRQFKDTVELLYNHPSIIFWEFINESQYPQGQMPQVIKEFVRYSRQIDPTRLVCGNSGFTASHSLIAKSNREWWGFSDQHWYYGWYVKTPFSADFVTDTPSKTIQYSPDDKKIMSEYGSTALPDWETWQDSFMPWEPPVSEDDIWDIRRIPVGRPVYRGITYMGDPLQCSKGTRYFGESIRPKDQIKRSQDYQAYQVKTLTDILRRRPDINGYVHFHLIDPGPVTWPKAIVDNKRRPKEAYFALAQASEPVRVNIQYQGRRFYSGSNIQDAHLWVYNDQYNSIHGSLRVFIADESGNILAEKNWTKDIEPATRVVVDKIDLQLPATSKRQKIFMYATLSDETGLINYDCLQFELFPKDIPSMNHTIALYDVVGNTADVLKYIGVEYRSWKPGQPLTDTSLLIIGAYSSDVALLQSKKPLREFLDQGGNVLVLNQTHQGGAGSQSFDLNQDYFAKVAEQITTVKERKRNIPKCDLSWLPFELKLIQSAPIQASYAQNVGRNELTDELKRDDMFELHGGYNIIFENAIEQRNDDETLLTCGPWQKYSAVLIKKVGQGKVLVSQLLLVNRYGVDPVASHLLHKMLEPDNWKKLPEPSISKSAILAKDGKELTVQLTISNPTDKEIQASIVDPILQDSPAGSPVQAFKQAIALQPGETRDLEFKRHMDEPFYGDLAPAVLIFEDGLWVSSELATVGIDPDEIKLIRTFDFGSKDSPLADGATLVANETVYSDSQGFGWDGKGGIHNIVTWTETPLLCDFNAYTGKKTFKVNLPAGEYVFRISTNSLRGKTYKDPYDNGSFPPVVVYCNKQKVGRIARMIPRKTTTLVFNALQESEGPIEIEFRSSFVGHRFGVSAIEIYQR